jgi:hypothetical protein
MILSGNNSGRPGCSFSFAGDGPFHNWRNITTALTTLERKRLSLQTLVVIKNSLAGQSPKRLGDGHPYKLLSLFSDQSASSLDQIKWQSLEPLRWWGRST